MRRIHPCLTDNILILGHHIRLGSSYDTCETTVIKSSKRNMMHRTAEQTEV